MDDGIALRTSEVMEQLQRSGLARYEAQLLVSLARLGTSSASELAGATGLNRVQVYRTLEALETLGFVDVLLGRPKRYLPRPMDEIFEQAWASGVPAEDRIAALSGS